MVMWHLEGSRVLKKCGQRQREGKIMEGVDVCVSTC